ncbi:NAD(P)-dependent oxidoreductase [Clavibacter sp. VKM Ac-2873]|uniref:NAD-dependent epimerase/dehydratase family protein n=1 Tax=Clavibacter sp. VKM Ac-2873 TaxID=2783813 RepID=UPI00188CD40E|nr:NAD(P)-dependent oxidoreductase [Clavibacter sp. VKM Ac-2873]MBF4619219.1 NAD(P)-dependent oxidoreductase [Clavibacter sp. VKM Ac-2873]
MTNPTRIVMTGAAGMAGRGVRPLLRAAGHELVLLDLVDPDPVDGERAVTASVRDLGAMREAVRGADLVVHLGGISRERPWDDVLTANVDGTRTVLEAARAEGVRRVLLASSTHAVGFHPVPTEPVADLAPRPDSLYGVTKAAMEALGSVYADRHGMSVVSARIGTLLERPTGRRSLSTWLSFPDLARLIAAVAALEEPGAHIVWGVSRNARAWFSPDAGERIGYYPEDDAEAFAAGIDDGDDADANGLIGGEWAAPEHALGDAW